jgi:hypothetical protein
LIWFIWFFVQLGLEIRCYFSSSLSTVARCLFPVPVQLMRTSSFQRQALGFADTSFPSEAVGLSFCVQPPPAIASLIFLPL